MPHAAPPTLETAVAADASALSALLAEAGLPTEELASYLPHFIVARRDGRVLGGVGLEPLGPWGLVRSLVVAEPERGHGLARAMCERLIAKARDQGIERLYLLTAVARPLFEQLGFHAIDRAEAPEAVRATEEFRTFRHPSAVCLTKALVG